MKKGLFTIIPTHLQEHQQGWLDFWRQSFLMELCISLMLFALENH